MIRKQIYLSEEMNRKLNELAKAKGVPQSEVIREGLEHYIAEIENKDKLWDELINEMKQSKIRNLEWNRDVLYQSEDKGLNHESND